MNIYEKLLEITNEMKNVNKNLEVGVGKSAYKAVGEADVLKAVKELEYKHKVYSYPVDRTIIDKDILQTKKEYNGQITEGNQLFMRLEVTYRFVNIEKPEEFIDIKTYGDGVDTQDKAPGKAMTYADKYALMKAYKIITGDDPDQNPSPDKNIVKNTKTTTKVDNKQIEDILNKKIQSGKHAGKTFLEICSSDMNYIDWLINEKKSDVAKQAKEEYEKSQVTISDEEFEEITK